jgi:hydroxymethylglutaryl-CoA lyase
LNFELKIIETPRDGFQGLTDFVPTDIKIRYINQLLKVGFHTVEVGSFVSRKAVPQMADTAEVIQGLDLSGTESRIMVLAATPKAAETAVSFSQVNDILYPFSFSNTFLQRNLKSDIDRAKATMREIQQICKDNDKQLIVYLSMAFGNPYGDPWSVEIVSEWVSYLVSEGIEIIPLSDISGDVSPSTIKSVFSSLMQDFPSTEFGIHLHCTPDDYFAKVEAAWECGVRRFDTVLGGIGGCPFAGDNLVSNLDTRALVKYLISIGYDFKLNLKEMEKAVGVFLGT